MGIASCRSRRAAGATAALAVAGAAAVTWYSAARLPLAREQELRVALTARDMVENGSWLSPRYRGQPRFQKPPLMYWLTALSYGAAGTTQEPIAARLSGMAFSLALLGLTYLGGRRLVGRRAAAAATAMAASSYLFLRFGFHCEADMAQAFWNAAAMFGAWNAVRTRRGGAAAAAWAWAGAAAGAGVLSKSPAPAAIVALAAALMAAARPPLRRRLGGAALALAVCAAVAGPWYGWTLWSGASRGAAGAAVAAEWHAMFDRPTHPGPWVFYLYTWPAAVAPWSVALAAALPRLARRARRHDRDLWLAAWLAAALLLLSAGANKQIHYVTLLLLPGSLAAGVWAVHAAPRWGRALRIHADVLDGLLAAGGVALLAAALAGGVARAAAGLGLAIAATGTAGLWRGGRAPLLPRPSTVLGIWLGAAAIAGPLAPIIEDKQIIVPFAAAVRQTIAAAPRVWVAGDAAAALEFHLGRPMVSAPSFAAAWRAAGGGDAVIVSSIGHPRDRTTAPEPVHRIEAGRRCLELHIRP